MRYFSFIILLLLPFPAHLCRRKREYSQGCFSYDHSNANDSLLPHRITLLFAGDLMQHQGQINAARTPAGYDYSDCFKFVKEEISRADIAVANLEVTLGGKPYRGYPAFSAPDEYLSAIREAGFNVLITANNHCLIGVKKVWNEPFSCSTPSASHMQVHTPMLKHANSDIRS